LLQTKSDEQAASLVSASALANALSGTVEYTGKPNKYPVENSDFTHIAATEVYTSVDEAISAASGIADILVVPYYVHEKNLELLQASKVSELAALKVSSDAAELRLTQEHDATKVLLQTATQEHDATKVLLQTATQEHDATKVLLQTAADEMLLLKSKSTNPLLDLTNAASSNDPDFYTYVMGLIKSEDLITKALAKFTGDKSLQEEAERTRLAELAAQQAEIEAQRVAQENAEAEEKRTASIKPYEDAGCFVTLRTTLSKSLQGKAIVCKAGSDNLRLYELTIGDARFNGVYASVTTVGNLASSNA